MTALVRHLILAALLLRAMVPMGWMPGTPALGQAAWIICTADGGVTHGDPGKDADRQHQQPCAYAAAHIIAPPQGLPLAAPSLRATAIAPPARRARIVLTAALAPQAPRAPPYFS